MRRVTVYTIKDRVESVEGDFFELIDVVKRRNGAFEEIVGNYYNTSFVTPIGYEFKRLALPVHTVVGPGDQVRHFSMHPELVEIFEAPVRKEMEVLRGQLRDITNNCLDWQLHAVHHLSCIEAFAGLSLWGRIKCAWRGWVPGVKRG